MPIIEMHLLVGRSSDDKARVASAVTAAAAESLGVSADTVRILITEHAKDEFYVAGRAGRASDQAAQAALQETVK
ncbi:tautomerase family protein [Marinobacterium sp. YM272]|uniref:tautomerase family protein n=1 Tax=Marinobacterium sp. YM272 TaxID=3421654 RepID=UPI003D7F2880